MNESKVIEIIVDLYKVKNICEKQTTCIYCPFYNKKCLFLDDNKYGLSPDEWEITPIMEKFAKGEITE